MIANKSGNKKLCERKTVIDVKRFSNWFTAVKHVAWLKRGIRNLFRKVRKLPAEMKLLCVQEVREAEKYLFQQAQRESFSEEIKCLPLPF